MNYVVKFTTVLTICWIVNCLPTGAQTVENKRFLTVKNKNISESNILLIEKDDFIFNSQYIDSLKRLNNEVFSSYLRANQINNSDQLILSYDNPVEVSEQLMIDSVWVTIREYYSTWSSSHVNPYQIDGLKFNDTINISLTYEQHGLNCSMPTDHEHHVTSSFGLRRWKWHYGDDIRIKIGDPIKAVFDGIVRIAKYNRRGYGHYVLVRHYNGLETLYGHLSKRKVVVGDVVKAGDTIGLGGNTGRSTGPHLHFEMRYEGNAFDPKLVFDFENDTIKTKQFSINPQTFEYLKEARKIRFHRIRRGDTLSGIAYRYGISINKICRLNGISRKTVLRIGRRLRIT